ANRFILSSFVRSVGLKNLYLEGGWNYWQLAGKFGLKNKKNSSQLAGKFGLKDKKILRGWVDKIQRVNLWRIGKTVDRRIGKTCPR
ncbi:MAG: hypothetical protein LBM00_11750, partial [Deltaproteobacteria bacterium]|nr:hypothetical protein [Deltaproteobacteria bacterium]